MKKFIFGLLFFSVMLVQMSVFAGVDIYRYSFDGINDMVYDSTAMTEQGNNTGKLTVNLNNGAKASIADYTDEAGADGKALKFEKADTADGVVKLDTGGEKFYTNYVMRMEISIWIPERNVPKMGLFALNRGNDGNGCIAVVKGGNSSGIYLADGQWSAGSLKLGTLKKGAWNTIEIDTVLNTGLMNFYLNGELTASQIPLNQDTVTLTNMKSQSIWSVSFAFDNVKDSVYVDDIVFRTIDKCTVSGTSHLTYENPKLIFECPSEAVLNAEDIQFKNKATLETFNSVSLEKLDGNKYIAMLPQTQLRPDTTYDIAFKKSVPFYTSVSIATEKIFEKGLLARNGVTLSYDFEDGQMAAGTLGTTNNCTTVIDSIEGYDGGKAVHLIGNENVTGKGSYLRQYFPGNQYKVCFEMDVMKPDTNSQTVWQAGEQPWPDILCFNKDKTITITDANGVVKNIGTYETNRWYSVAVELDTTAKIINVMVTDIESDKKMAIGTVAMKAMKAGYASALVTELRELTGTASKAYVDNLKISNYNENTTPAVSEVYALAGTQKFPVDNIPINAEFIVVRFSQPMNDSTLTEETIKLSLDYTPDYNDTDNTYVMTLNENIEYGEEFSLSFINGIMSADGKKLLWDNEYIMLETEKRPFVIADTECFVDGDEITSISQLKKDDILKLNFIVSNLTQATQKGIILSAFYDASGTMQSIKLKHVDTTKKTSEYTCELPISENPQNGMVRVMFIDNLKDMNCIGSVYEIK